MRTVEARLKGIFPVPFSCAIETLQNIVHTNAEGSVTTGDLHAHMQLVIDDPLFRPGMNAAADLRKAKILMSLQDAPALVRLFLQQAKIRKRGSWAVVIDRHPEVHLIRFFISFMEHLPFNMRVFDNSVDAIRWLQRGEADLAADPG